MKLLSTILLVFSATVVCAEDAKGPVVAKGTKIVQTDAYGRTRYNVPAWRVEENGRIVEVSPYGQRQPQKQQYVIKGDRVYHADFAGRVQHNKSSWTVRKDGRVVQNDAYGNPQYHKPQYVVEDETVYSTDATGQAKRPAYEIKK